MGAALPANCDSATGTERKPPAAPSQHVPTSSTHDTSTAARSATATTSSPGALAGTVCPAATPAATPASHGPPPFSQPVCASASVASQGSNGFGGSTRANQTAATASQFGSKRRPSATTSLPSSISGLPSHTRPSRYCSHLPSQSGAPDPGIPFRTDTWNLIDNGTACHHPSQASLWLGCAC